jgi:hypothetical protein
MLRGEGEGLRGDAFKLLKRWPVLLAERRGVVKADDEGVTPGGTASKEVSGVGVGPRGGVGAGEWGGEGRTLRERGALLSASCVPPSSPATRSCCSPPFGVREYLRGVTPDSCAFSYKTPSIQISPVPPCSLALLLLRELGWESLRSLALLLLRILSEVRMSDVVARWGGSLMVLRKSAGGPSSGRSLALLPLRISGAADSEISMLSRARGVGGVTSALSSDAPSPLLAALKQNYS